MSSDSVALHFDAGGSEVEVRLPQLTLPAFLPATVEGLSPNWDAWLVDRRLGSPNSRALPKEGTTAYAALPCDTRGTVWMGHPVLADTPDLHIRVCHLLPREWLVSLHNPSDRPITSRLHTARGWPFFALKDREWTVPAGASVDIPIRGTE